MKIKYFESKARSLKGKQDLHASTEHKERERFSPRHLSKQSFTNLSQKKHLRRQRKKKQRYNEKPAGFHAEGRGTPRSRDDVVWHCIKYVDEERKKRFACPRSSVRHEIRVQRRNTFRDRNPNE